MRTVVWGSINFYEFMKITNSDILCEDTINQEMLDKYSYSEIKPTKENLHCQLFWEWISI